MIARKVYYEGRVQGVGFRFRCKQLARGFEITGSVRNLPDGRVELHCAGEPGEVDGFLEAITESELGAHIKNVTVTPLEPLAEFRGFEIVA